MRRRRILAVVALAGITATAAVAQVTVPDVDIQIKDEQRERVDRRPPYEYKVVGPIAGVGMEVSVKTEENLNRFTSEGWDLLNLRWSEDLARTVIVFRRIKTPPIKGPEEGERE